MSHDNPLLDAPELGRSIWLGIDLQRDTEQLEQEGIQKSIDAYQRLLQTLNDRGAR